MNFVFILHKITNLNFSPFSVVVFCFFFKKNEILRFSSILFYPLFFYSILFQSLNNIILLYAVFGKCDVLKTTYKEGYFFQREMQEKGVGIFVKPSKKVLKSLGRF